METLSKEEFLLYKDVYINKILDGELFIHPTDTIYGIGCDATNGEAVQRIRHIKDQTKRPFSVLAPSKKWIYENCKTNTKEREWIKKLPGPYTLILRLKNKAAIAPETNAGLDAVGIRIPDHWFSAIATEANKPLITTSANLSGEDYMTSMEDLHPRIKSKMSFAVYEGEKKSRPSKLIDLTKEEIKVVER